MFGDSLLLVDGRRGDAGIGSRRDGRGRPSGAVDDGLVSAVGMLHSVMEYCVRLLTLVAEEGVLGGRYASTEVAAEIGKIFNEYAAEGWELFVVTPVTDGAANIQQAYHYFRRSA